MSRKPIFLLTYDHGGYILWGDRFEEKLDSAADWLDKYGKFKIGLDNESFAYDEYAKSNPAIIKKINDMLAKYKGRFALGSATYGQPLSVFISEESNARQIIYAVRANLKHFGQTPNIYAISEHALHNQIPQLAAQAGYEGAIMRTHFMMYGFNPTYDAPYGWWVGEDGTRIPCVPTYEGEGAAFGITTLDNWVLTRWPDRTTHSLEEFGEKFRHITPLLASRYDDIVHRHEGMVEYVEDFDEYRWVILEDLPAIYGEPKEDFVPTSNDFRVRMPWGYCGNEIFNDCSAAETAVTLAERVNATALLLGGCARQEKLEEAWKNLLVSQHHDIQICGLLKDSRKYLPASRAASKEVTDESMAYLADQFATPGAHNLVVYNTHSFPVCEKVETEIYQRGTVGYTVSLNGRDIPCEAKVLDYNRAGLQRSLVSFIADVPANTLCCYSIALDKPTIDANANFAYCADTGVLTTPLYEIALDQGGIRRLKDLENGALYIDTAKGNLFKGAINDADERSQGAWSVSIASNSARATYVGTIGGIPVRFEMDFYAARRRIDCKANFTFSGERIGRVDLPDRVNGFAHENKLRFVLETRLGGDCKNTRDLPYVISESDDPLYIQGNYWAARRDADLGIALFNRGARGAVANGAEFSLPLAYANTYIWGTRMLYGDYGHEFAIYPFAAGLGDMKLHKEALSYSYPPLCRATGEHAGKLKNSYTVLSLGAGDGVVMTALYPEDGAVILRCCEYDDAEESLAPQFTDGTVQEPVTIMGKPMPEAAGDTIGRRAVKSFRVRAY